MAHQSRNAYWNCSLNNYEGIKRTKIKRKMYVDRNRTKVGRIACCNREIYYSRRVPSFKHLFQSMEGRSFGVKFGVSAATRPENLNKCRVSNHKFTYTSLKFYFQFANVDQNQQMINNVSVAKLHLKFL